MGNTTSDRNSHHYDHQTAPNAKARKPLYVNMAGNGSASATLAARKAEFLAALKRTKDIRAACVECGLTRATITRWKGRNPVFGVEMELAMESP